MFHTHTPLGQNMFSRAKKFFYPRSKGCEKKKIRWQRWSQSESCCKRTHLKGNPKQQLPPCCRLQCAAPYKLREARERVLSAAHPGLKPKSQIPPVLPPSISPAPAAITGEKNKLPFTLLQHGQEKGLYQKTREVTNVSKLGPQAQFPQWSETCSASADRVKTCGLHLKSSDRHFLFTDAEEEKSSSLFTQSSACLCKALHHCNSDELMRKTWNLKEEKSSFKKKNQQKTNLGFCFLYEFGFCFFFLSPMWFLTPHQATWNRGSSAWMQSTRPSQVLGFSSTPQDFPLLLIWKTSHQ